VIWIQFKTICSSDKTKFKHVQKTVMVNNEHLVFVHCSQFSYLNSQCAKLLLAANKWRTHKPQIIQFSSVHLKAGLEKSLMYYCNNFNVLSNKIISYDHLPVMRRRQLLNDIMHFNEFAIITVLHCSLQSISSQPHYITMKFTMSNDIWQLTDI